MRSEAGAQGRRGAGAQAAALGLMLVLAGLAGCERTVNVSSVVDTQGSAAAEMDFWQGLETVRILSTNDALHGLLLVADGRDGTRTWERRLAEAKRRRWLPRDAAPQANESVTVGTVAVASCRIMEVKGGLTMRVFGPSPRYCTRELIFMEILPPRSEQQAMSGLEFLDLVGRMQDSMEHPQ